MADKIVSTIKISNNDADRFVLKSTDSDKVSELYNEVFGNNTDENGLKAQIAKLENEISILKEKIDSLYDRESHSPNDDSLNSFNV